MQRFQGGKVYKKYIFYKKFKECLQLFPTDSQNFFEKTLDKTLPFHV